MRIYFDNNATTPVHPDVLAILERELRATYGNASSVHEEGQRARRLLEGAREQLAALIGASSREIVFTSGGSESNNAAILGALAQAGEKRHLVTSAIEHPSVLEVVRELERRGHPVTFVGCNGDGVVEASSIAAALRDDTALVCLMLANNETGVLQPVREAAALVRERGIHLHCDAVQAAGRAPIDVKDLGVDTLSLSGHKMHSPKGIGALYVRTGLTLQPIILGGAQERRRRAGTENVPMACAFGVAAELAQAGTDALAALRDHFERELCAAFPFVRVNGEAAPRIPNTSNLCFPGHDGEGLVIALDLAGIAVSSGSACSSGRVEPSHVLLAMGLSMEDARGSVRFSLGRQTTREEIDRAIALIRDIVPKHRKGAAGTPLEVHTTTP